MKRMNRKERKEQRRVEAKARQEAYDALTPEERIEKAREERRPLSGEEAWKLYGYDAPITEDDIAMAEQLADNLGLKKHESSS